MIHSDFNLHPYVITLGYIEELDDEGRLIGEGYLNYGVTDKKCDCQDANSKLELSLYSLLALDKENSLESLLYLVYLLIHNLPGLYT